MRYRLLALDVDGTLVGRSNRVSPRTREVLRAAQAAGVDLVLATGRAGDGAAAVVEDLRLAQPVGLALCNGAVLADSTEHAPFGHAMLDVATAREVVIAARAAGATPFVYQDPLRGQTIAADLPRRALPSFVDHDVHDVWYGDVLEWLREPPLVVVVAGLEAVLLPWAERWRAEYAGRATVAGAPYHADDLWILTFVHPSADKGAAVAAFAARRGVPLSDVMAIGDADNDVAMLAEVGWGVAMGDASPAALAAADAVTGTVDDDGLAAAVERWVLNS